MVPTPILGFAGKPSVAMRHDSRRKDVEPKRIQARRNKVIIN